MSKGVKIALVVIAAVLVLCCIGGLAVYFVTMRAVSQAFTEDPTQAAKIGHEIVDYTLPPGYRERAAMNAVVFKMVVIGPESQSTDSMILALMQISAGSNLSQEEMERQVRQAMAQQGQRSDVQVQVVGTQRVTIKGQPVTLTVSEGSGDGGDYRQVTGVFPGKGGLAMLMAMGAKDSWNEATLAEFLASIK